MTDPTGSPAALGSESGEDEKRRRTEAILLLVALALVLGLLFFGCLGTDRLPGGPGHRAEGAPSPKSVGGGSGSGGSGGSGGGSPAGTGSGLGTVSGGGAFAVSGDVEDPLGPGDPPAQLDLVVHNPLDRSIDVTKIDVSVAGFPPGCRAADFVATGFTGLAVVPARSALTLRQVDAVGTLPSIQMLETHDDQDGCRGASLHLVYRAVAS